MSTQTIPEAFTESRSITGRSTFNRTKLLETRHWPASQLTFRDMVELDARTEVGIECSEYLGIEPKRWATEDVIVSSTQFNTDGDIVVWWTARFRHAPKELS